MTQIRRSVLFMPGDSLRKISKATQLAADSIVLDLEDSVTLDQKEAARRTVTEALQRLDFGRRERLIRLNPARTGLQTADLSATITARPDGYVLPKVNTAAQLQQVDRWLTEAEQANGWPAGSIRLLAIIETALGVINLKEIARSSNRLEALMFGAEDLAGDMGAQRTPAGWEVFYARSAVVTVAAGCGLQAIDMVLVDLANPERLEAECRVARQLGYQGKMAIHPRQLEPINRIFAPTPQEIAQAQRLLRRYANHQAAGAGVFELDGQMVDMPMVKMAERVLAKARAAGLLEQNQEAGSSSTSS